MRSKQQDGKIGLGLGESGETGDSREEELGYTMETSYHFIHQNTKNIC